MKQEDKALLDIIQGKAPEKKIWVPVGVHKKEEPSEEELAEKAARDEAIKSARMPWFCPVCSDVMNGKFDRKFFYARGKCFDCVVREETTMRINGTFDLYQKITMLRNSLGMLRDAEAELTEAMTAISNPSFVHENGGVELWSGVDLDEVRSRIEGDLNGVQESIQDIETDLREMEDEFERKTRDAQQAKE